MNAMDKRLKEHIDELIRLYDEARTTDEQERELADFFSQPHDTLPEEWERYAALFTAFAESESLFSEAELEEMTAPLPHRSRRVWPWTLGAAAAIALLIGFFLYHPQTPEAPDYLATTEQPTPDMEELGITTVDSALIGRIAGLDIVPNSAHLGDSNHVMRLGGDCPPLAESTAISKSRGTLLLGYQRREEETIPAYVVLVNGELLPDSMNYLATLSLNKIREYFLSRGEVVEDFDYRAVKDEKGRQKYGDIAKGKNGIVELRIKTKPVQDSLFVK